jgi:hypothetical protein
MPDQPDGDPGQPEAPGMLDPIRPGVDRHPLRTLFRRPAALEEGELLQGRCVAGAVEQGAAFRFRRVAEIGHPTLPWTAGRATSFHERPVLVDVPAPCATVGAKEQEASLQQARSGECLHYIASPEPAMPTGRAKVPLTMAVQARKKAHEEKASPELRNLG